MVQFKIVSGKMAGTEQVARRFPFRIGRSAEADLRLEDDGVWDDHLELSVKINDPQIYTKPWVALDKMRFEIQPDDFDVREFICAPSEYRDYNKELGDPASTK